jgi:DNA-binding GntR family transcriptional regulator
MSSVESETLEVFRPERYPAIRSVVEAENGPARSLSDKAGDKILKRIISGEFPAGMRLKSTELGHQLGMSRTPVSKAMAKLALEGILTQPNNLQAIVTPEACDWLIHTHELRQLLEPAAAERATGKLPKEVLDDLRVLARDVRMNGSGLWEEAAKFLDFAIHLALAEFCGNVPMKVSIRRCWKYKILSYELSEGCRSNLPDEYEQHLAILAAVAEGDSQRARKEMAFHLQVASAERFAPHVV